MGILIYGDQNTRGVKSNKGGKVELYPEYQRWTTILCNELYKEGFRPSEIKIDALDGRGIVAGDPKVENSNAIETYKKDFEKDAKNLSIDCCIIALGLNDSMYKNKKTVGSITKALDKMVKYLNDEYLCYNFIFICPPFINIDTRKFNRDTICGISSHMLRETGSNSLNIGAVQTIGLETDGEHLTPESHKYLAMRSLEAIKNMDGYLSM